MATVKEPRSKFTASVREKVVAMVDERCATLNLSRSDAVEEAMEMWLHKQEELDEEKYFAEAASEMNADARQWNSLTTKSLTQSRKRK